MLAFDHAETVGSPLNTPFTVSFQGSRPYDVERRQVGVRATEANTRACRNCVTRAIRDTAREFGVPLTYLFAFENPPEGGMGLHLHGLLHVPDHCREAFLARFDLKLKNALDTQSNRNGQYVPVRIEEERREFEGAVGWLAYFLKGWDVPQGRIFGPRLTIGRAINKGAQHEAGSSVSFNSDDRHQAVDELRARRRARLDEWRRRVLRPALLAGRTLGREGGGKSPE